MAGLIWSGDTRPGLRTGETRTRATSVGSGLRSAFVVSALVAAPMGRDGRVQGIVTALVLAAAAASAIVIGRTRRLPVSLPVGALLGWTALSVLWVPHRLLGLVALANFSGWILVGAALALICSVDRIGPTIVLAARAAVVANVVLVAVSGGIDDRQAGMFNSKNHLGFVLALSIAALVSSWLDERRALDAALLLAAVGLLLGSNSATGILLGAAVPAALATIAMFRRPRLRPLGCVLLAGVAVGLVLGYGSVTAAVGRDGTLSRRSDVWKSVWVEIGERPLTGVGIGGVWADRDSGATKAILDRLPLWMNRDAVVYAHNTALDVWLQLGLIGLGLYAAVHAAAAKAALALARAGSWRAQIPVLWLGLSVLGGMTESRAFNDLPVVLVSWFLASAVVATGDDSTNPSSGAPPPRTVRWLAQARPRWLASPC